MELLLHQWTLFLCHSIRVLQLPIAIDYVYQLLHRYIVIPQSLMICTSKSAHNNAIVYIL